jgi:hypothetical protein
MGDRYNWNDWMNSSFTWIKHRVNNTVWMMIWWWKEGVERSANPNIERMLNFFDIHLSAPEEKAVPRICAFKTRCLQFKQSCPWASLSYFCTQKTSREINEVGRVVLRKNVSEKLSIINPLWRRRNPCNLIPLTLLPKNHNLLCKAGLKKGAGEKGKSVTTSLYCKSIITEGEGMFEERWRGGGGGSFTQSSHEPGDM